MIVVVIVMMRLGGGGDGTHFSSFSQRSAMRGVLDGHDDKLHSYFR
jgi:hypothetical protein